MTNRAQEIERSLTALATALRQHHDQVAGSATTAEERALSCWEHGWDGLAQGYETASGHLTEIAGELVEVCERAERCAQILQPLHDEHGLTGVAERLGTATDEIDTGLEAVLSQLDEIRTTLAATGEEYLVGVLQDVVEQVQESGEALAAVQKEIAEEQASARPGESARIHPPTTQLVPWLPPGPVSQNCGAKATPHNAMVPRSPMNNSPTGRSGARTR